MPRLLLVDDNPSIHKIAETLLAATDIELVCLESGEEALRRVKSGEPFDAALLDIAMAGLDGWGLLEQLRAHPATARIPIAMMAGVLDTVDPERIQAAPIQGFLKKPVELRDLGDRIHRLLESPLPVPPSAVDTIPAAPVAELLAGESDVLVLGPDDLLPEDAGAGLEASLELEELDLETLHGLPEAPAAAPAAAPEPAIADAWGDEAWEKAPPMPELAPVRDEIPFLVTSDELPDLGDLVAASEAPTVTLDVGAAAGAAAGAAPTGLPAGGVVQEEIELSIEEELDLGLPLRPPQPPPPPALPPAAGIAAGAAVGAATGAALGAGVTAFAMKEAAPAPASSLPPPALPGSARAAVEAILQDPEALDLLAKALAGRFSERALQEVAWEVLPELAERLKR